ncbi:MAG: hypothetical protein L6455_14635 [Kiritimatiellae bacterium]|nr:hypothetical protein [Kiritimatiellia bacterium]
MSVLSELTAKASLNGAQFKAEVKNIGNSVTSLGSNQLAGLKGMIAGAFSVGVLIQFGRKILQTADDLQTAANIFGLSLETMIAFKSVMAESGIGADRFNKIFGRIASAQVDVRNGLATYVDALKEMNISSAEFQNLGIDKVLELMVKKYAEVGNKQQFVGGMAKLLGARTIDLIEVFQRMNKEGMAKYAEEAKVAADGMNVLAKASDSFEKAGSKIINWAATAFGWLQKVTNAALTAGLALWGMAGKGGGFVDRMRVIKEGWWAGWNITSPPPKTPGAGGGPSGVPGPADAELTAIKKTSDAWLKYYDILDDEAKKQMDREDKYMGLIKNRQELELDFAKKKADIMAGRGITSPEMSRIDALQRIGGLIGAAGGGDQAARRAERQEKILEATERLQQEHNNKLDEIKTAVNELNE